LDSKKSDEVDAWRARSTRGVARTSETCDGEDDEDDGDENDGGDQASHGGDDYVLSGANHGSR